MSESPLRVLSAPAAGEIAGDVEGLLEQLGGPTWIVQPGRDRSRMRALCTLLHGNEPSGLLALHAWLRSGRVPEVDCVFFVGAVAAALEAPRFSRRVRRDGRDLNRCFRPPFDDDDGRLARAVLAELRKARPEALLDLHNTSGDGPAYGVATRLGAGHTAMLAPFADHVVLTDLRLGTLIEAVEDEWPALVVECGGASDPAAHALAKRGLKWFVTSPSVLDSRPEDAGPQVLAHPVRVELRPGYDVFYDERPHPDVAVTLRSDVDRHNFGVVAAGTQIGWMPGGRLDILEARTATDHDRISEFFRLEGDRLILERPLRLFMITTNASIARDDCLFYAVGVTADD